MSDRGQAAGEVFDPTTQGELPASDVLRLHLLRHGEVESFERRVVRGQLDVALSDTGRAQHVALERWLAAHVPAPDRLFTSDLSRCAHLAQLVGERTGVPVTSDPRLREQCMGAWQGRTWEEITRDGAQATHDYWADYLEVAPPGGESLLELSARVVAWWEELRAALPNGRVVVATHVGPIRALVCHLLGVPASETLRFAPALASHTSLLVSDAGAVIETFGERPWLFDGADASAAGPRTGARAGARRIALSGSAGTGKTTLGRRLADELGLPFIEEGMRARLEAGLDLRGLDSAGWQRLIRELWAEQRAAEERCPDGFVSDRSSMDYAAFWLHYGQFEPRDACESFLAEMFAESRRYERILLFPWGVLPLEHDAVRSTNRWLQFGFQSLLEGLLEHEVDAGRVARIPRSTDLEQRLAWVLAELARAVSP